MSMPSSAVLVAAPRTPLRGGRISRLASRRICWPIPVDVYAYASVSVVGSVVVSVFVSVSVSVVIAV